MHAVLLTLADGNSPGTTGYILLVVGLALGAGAVLIRERLRTSQQKAEFERLERAARARADETLKAAEVDAQKKQMEALARFERETSATREELKTAEKRLEKREDGLDKKLDVLVTKERKIEEAEQRLERAEKEIVNRQQEMDQLLAQSREDALRIARMTPEEARDICLKRIEGELERETGEMVEKMIGEAKETAKDKSRQILVEAIQRYASEHTCEATVASVDVPTDEMKGRIIGREGRNIRSFEKATGVTLIVDDTPGIVAVSCFDPVRKEVARASLERLIKDGRIHPTRIEEIVETTAREIDEKMVEIGRQAALEANVNGLNKKIVDTLGKLHFRTSYGQNVLRHSIEVAHLCGTMASELGLDAPLARRCGLLHDIGKAMDHEVEGTHTKLGADFVRKFNEHAAVINAVAGHHGDIPAMYPYTPLVTAADAVSASRPGGRRESLERYIKRLEELEAIAKSFPGIRSAYAVEAGREVRVIVDANRVDDRSSLKLARDIATKIEETMTYPGEIKITVLREIRAVEYAK